MAIVVKLSEVVEAIDLPSEDWHSYLNRDTGNIEDPGHEGGLHVETVCSRFTKATIQSASCPAGGRGPGGCSDDLYGRNAIYHLRRHVHALEAQVICHPGYVLFCRPMSCSTGFSLRGTTQAQRGVIQQRWLGNRLDQRYRDLERIC